jgi:hypothetical protein
VPAGRAAELGLEHAICDRECRAFGAHLGRRSRQPSPQEAGHYKALLRRRARIADEWRAAVTAVERSEASGTRSVS